MIEFRKVQLAPVQDFTAEAPSGAVIGIIGETDSGASELLRLAAGIDQHNSGEIVAPGTRRYLAASDPLNLAPSDILLIDHTFSRVDAFTRARALSDIERLRTAGTTILIASHDPGLLHAICDEVWWLETGRLVRRGDPAEVLDAYHACIAQKFRRWGETVPSPLAPLAPAMRKGDGRAEILSLEIVGASGKATAVLQSGEDAGVRVSVRFKEAVESPVIGMLIRTRIGLEVYGTNTELEHVNIGRCAAGEVVRIEFRFRCDLCPKVYTLTAASHDPDGTAHDWVDDAVSFTVTDSRYTAGVANLHASVMVERVSV